MDETLEQDPETFRKLGYDAIDLIASTLEQRQNKDEPAHRAVPEDIRKLLQFQDLPEHGESPKTLLEFIAKNVFPYPLGHNNPRFFAWVNSPGAPVSVLGELLAAGMNSSAAGGDQASTYLEHAVLSWLKEIMGFPPESGALLVSGGSMASVVGLAVMRFAKSNKKVRTQGVQQGQAPMVVYTSSEGHSCIQKAVELLGIGSDHLRKVSVDRDFRMNTKALANQVREDRNNGLQPVCVAATAGTVNTGAIDP